jgi:thiamine kinase
LAQSLSAATRSEIEHVTRLCQRLEFFVSQPPVQVRLLSQGESNQSYYVRTSQAEYVLRCYPAESAICRQQELRCQHAAAANALAPAPLCLNNHYQVLLSDYIRDGEPYNPALHCQDALLSVLARFHQLPVQTPILNCAVYLQQLAAAVSDLSLLKPALLTALQRAAEQLQQYPADIVLCHLDLHAGNILYADNKLWLLDFEYSQQADSCLDLAAVCLHFNLSVAEQSRMLMQYVSYRQQPALNSVLPYKLAAAKQLYCGFCWLWYLALPGFGQQAQLWQQRLLQLI